MFWFRCDCEDSFDYFMDSIFFLPGFQDMLNEAESKAAGLGEELKAEKKLHVDVESAATTLEQVATTAAKKLKILTTSHEEEKASLLKHAKEAENRLEPLSEELGGLKRHITHMTQAIFGSRSEKLRQEPLVKLKAVYTLLEQLYAGSLFTIMSMMGHNESPKLIKDVLKQLSTMPKQIEELKKSADRSAAMLSLSRAKAYVPDMDLSELAGGFPEFKMDRSEFTSMDYSRCLKETRVIVSQLVEELDLKRYQAAYDKENVRANPPTCEPIDLTPARHKHIFAPDVDPSIIMGEDAELQALTTLDWDFKNLQIRRRTELGQDDPETQAAREQHGADPATNDPTGVETGAQE